MNKKIEVTREDILSAWEDTGPVETYRVVCGDVWANGLVRLVPAHMREGVVLWIVLGERPGDFLTAVLENDLKGAVTRADDINRQRLSDIVGFLYQYTPMHCFGSERAVKEWRGIYPREVQVDAAPIEEARE